MIDIKNPADCCGCTACASICAHDAITMKPDALGFLYPEVNRDKCVNCGLCEKVCAFNDHYDISSNLKKPRVYAVRHKNIHEIETSRSGAAFIAISDYILENGGVVYGAGYTDHFRVVHKRAVTKEERNEFKGSKYVQSDMNTVFRQVKKDLRDGLTVLFSGTPCQTAGLNSYVGKRLRGNLILVDIVCHGVPSPYIWRDYILWLEKKHGRKIITVNFRDKSRIGWAGHIESYVFSNGKKIEATKYKDLFFMNIMLRSSCSVCKFSNTRRPSDFTIGDFWGLYKFNSDFNKDNKGVSLLLVNTEKAITIFQKVTRNINFLQFELQQCMQPNLIKPSIFSPLSDSFAVEYENKGFEVVRKRYIGWRYEYRKRMIAGIRSAKNTVKKWLKIW